MKNVDIVDAIKRIEIGKASRTNNTTPEMTNLPETKK